MPSEKECNQYMKSDKMPYNIYAEGKSSSKNTDGCVNNFENFSTTKIGGYSTKICRVTSCADIVCNKVWEGFVNLLEDTPKI